MSSGKCQPYHSLRMVSIHQRPDTAESKHPPNAHRESVDVLVHEIQQRNRLDDVVIVLLHREFDFCAGVCVPQTELCSAHIAGLERPQQLAPVKTQSTE